MRFLTADSLPVNTSRNVIAPRKLVRQLQYVVSLFNELRICILI